jgi:N6-L-threonylcarbamoyladenine synthase
MRILAIETSCDETAIAIIEADGSPESARFEVLGNALLSQIEIHAEYGGVFPQLAKREHAKNLVPILEAALEEAELLREDVQTMETSTRDAIAATLAREHDLAEAFFEFIGECEPPEIDAIAVTTGPGLEPALWVGINFAKALALAWNKPVVAVNHMEGHILAALAQKKEELFEIANVAMPIMALLISGGHTELVLMKAWLSYSLMGQTRDDAVGEAFDKVARMLNLPYPGGPQISTLAEIARTETIGNPFTLPRPMMNEDSCDFSFAGLKTSVLYQIKKLENVSEAQKKHIAHEFENAVTDVLWKKTARALTSTHARTLVIGGGVSANIHIRRTFKEKNLAHFPEVSLRIPSTDLSTDNAIMIAFAGFYRALRGEYQPLEALKASGNLPLT